MAYPFKPLSTEKLKKAFKRMVERNCRSQDTNQCLKKPSGKKAGNKLCCPARILETWGQRVINH